MKGGSLTRFRPDPQDGGGFVQELLKASVRGGLKGLKAAVAFEIAFERQKRVQHGALSKQ